MESNHRPLDRQSGAFSTRPPLPKIQTTSQCMSIKCISPPSYRDTELFKLFKLFKLFMIFAVRSFIDGVTAPAETPCGLNSLTHKRKVSYFFRYTGKSREMDG